jgi:SAM-dependent methyltransferase
VHLNSLLLFQKFLAPRIAEGVRVLEIGPDRFPSTIRSSVSTQNIIWETLDLADRPGITYRATHDYSFPIPEGTFDFVIAVQVLEHVKKIWRWFPELARILKPGGELGLVSPISWPYHEAPVDCWRVYPEGIRALCDDSGLDCVLSQELSLEQETFWELCGYGRMYAGVSCSNDRISGRLKNILRRLMLKPIPYAVDVVTVARKPQNPS